MPSIYCSINGYNFYKTTSDTGSGVNIMAAVTYRLLFETMPLNPTYIQLQMADQTFREVKGIVTDVPVKIDDYFVHTDFRLLTWEKTNTIHPSSLEDRSSAPLKQSSTLELEKSICTSPQRRYDAILLTLTISLKTLSRSGNDATATRGGRSLRTDGQTMKEKY